MQFWFSMDQPYCWFRPYCCNFFTWHHPIYYMCRRVIIFLCLAGGGCSLWLFCLQCQKTLSWHYKGNHVRLIAASLFLCSSLHWDLVAQLLHLENCVAWLSCLKFLDYQQMVKFHCSKRLKKVSQCCKSIHRTALEISHSSFNLFRFAKDVEITIMVELIANSYQKEDQFWKMLVRFYKVRWLPYSHGGFLEYSIIGGGHFFNSLGFGPVQETPILFPFSLAPGLIFNPHPTLIFSSLLYPTLFPLALFLDQH